MAEAIISDWISDYSSLQESELRTFAAQHENDFEISKALYTILNERAKYKDLIYPVCNQLCSFYRSNEVELRRFTLQFVPILIYLYLNSVAMGDKKGCRSIETLLICIYNIEVSGEDGSPKVVSFRMPVLAQASIYHEEKSLHPSDLRRWEENSNKEISWGPLPSIESVNAQNRLKVMTALLFTYNQQLNQIHKPALYHLCKTTSQLATQGFAKIGHVQRASYGTSDIHPTSTTSPSSTGSGATNSPSSQNTFGGKSLPRIAVSSQFLVELAHANYFAMFNEFASAAIEAVRDLHQRACYEMLPEVILVTNAIRNSLHANPSGQPSDGPMGISVALTPATTTVTVSKSMITNASFRTKKLPDDIPIQGPKEENGTGAAGQLSSINEEGESGTEPGKATAGSGPAKTKDSKTHKVLVGFKKLKDKDKDKDDGGGGSSKKSSGVGASAGTTKEKLTGKQSLQMMTGSSASELESDKTSPLTMAKRKSTSVDVISVPSVAMVPPPMANGGVLMGTGGGDEGKDTLDRNGGTGVNPLEVGESFDSGNEMTITNNNNNNNINHSTEKSVLEMKSSIQVSQV